MAWTAATVAGAYAAVAISYILLSDRFVGMVFSDPTAIVEYSSVKGVAFVLVTALGLFVTWTVLARREWREREQRMAVQQRLADLVGGLPNPLLVVGEDGRLLEYNEAFASISAYPADRLARMGVADLTHPDDLPVALSALSSTVSSGASQIADVRLVTGDGAILRYRWHGAPVRDVDGRITGAAVAGIDMTDLHAIRAELQQSLRQAKEQLRQTVHALTAAVEKRGPYTAGHERRVAALCEAIGTELGLPEDRLECLEYAAILHDVGEMGVPADILVRPTRLTETEFEIVKTHAEHGYEIVREIAFPWPVAEIVHQHHERLDGSGYPQGLSGEGIRLEARIIAVADVVEAMCSHRPYRPAVGMEGALAELRAGRAGRYDAAVVDACLTVFREGFAFPRIAS